MDEECARRSLRMAREIEQRLTYGDVNRVGWAVDRLVKALCWQDGCTADDLISSLRKNAYIDLWWVNLVMVYWGRCSDELEIATGKTREQWLKGV